MNSVMNRAPLTLQALNAMPVSSFVAALGETFEHAPWVAEAAAAGRPYPTVSALHEAMAAVVATAAPNRQTALIAGHPELGSRIKRADMTEHSQAEQGALGLDRLSAEDFGRFEHLNRAYREKFEFPFIICVRRHTRNSILRQFESRLGNSVDAERMTALREIGLIARLRLASAVEGPGMPNTTGRLTTHVLDTASGKPAAGIKISLYEVGTNARGLLREAITNADGRTDVPLIDGEPLRIGQYELAFAVGDYFAKCSGGAATDPPFLDVVPIHFSIAEPEGHYHVPLLVTPWGYTTYRGS